jgi:phage gp36-like protein
MAYIDETYIKYFIPLVDYPVLVTSTAIRDVWITAAEDEIDSHCRPIYDIPFDDPPPFIKRLAVALFIYYAYAHTGQIPDRVQKSYDLAVENLDKINKRILKLTDGESNVDDSYYNSRFLSTSGLGIVGTPVEKHVKRGF